MHIRIVSGLECLAGLRISFQLFVELVHVLIVLEALWLICEDSVNEVILIELF